MSLELNSSRLARKCPQDNDKYFRLSENLNKMSWFRNLEISDAINKFKSYWVNKDEVTSLTTKISILYLVLLFYLSRIQ